MTEHWIMSTFNDGHKGDGAGMWKIKQQQAEEPGEKAEQPKEERGFLIQLICFWLCWVFVAAFFPLAAAGRGYSEVAVHGLLIAVASLVTQHGALGSQASALEAPRL